MIKKIVLSLVYISVSSTLSYANSSFVEADIAYSNIEKRIDLQSEKLELSKNRLDGYIKMLDMTNSSLSKNLYTPKKIVACK